MIRSSSYKWFLPVLLLSFLIFGCSDSSTGPGNRNGNETDFNSQANAGSSAEAFLQDDTYTELTLEIDYMPGHQPTQQALDGLKTFLQQRLNKATITFRAATEVPSGGEQEYSADEIRNLEEQYRDNFTEAGSNTLEAF